MSQIVEEDTLQVTVEVQTDQINEFTTNAGVSIEQIDFKGPRLVQVDSAQKGDLFVDDGTSTIRQHPGADGEVLIVDSGQPSGMSWINPTELGSTITSVIWYELSVGTNGPQPTAGGVWDTVLMNKISGTGGTDITFDGTSQFTLKSPGTYFVYGSAPAFKTDDHQTRIFNTTTNTTEFYGTAERANNGQMTNRSFVHSTLVYTGTTSQVLELQHQAKTKTGGALLGRANGFDNEVYAMIQVFKIG